MQIVDMKTLDAARLAQAAQMLTDELPQGWATFDDAMEEIDELFNHEDGELFLAAVENGEVLGWCG